MRIRVLAAGLVLGLAACGGAERQAEEQAAAAATRAQAAADTLAMAVAAYDPAGFDTISWDDDTAALNRGATVYRFSCQKCHGAGGQGDAGFVMGGDTLHPPSFLGEDWAFAQDPEGLREQVFIGTTEGMPHWGLEGLSYRDVDAVSRFIQMELRN